MARVRKPIQHQAHTGGCAFIEGEPSADESIFCGRPVADTSPWCPYHKKIVYAGAGKVNAGGDGGGGGAVGVGEVHILPPDSDIPDAA